MRIAIAEALDPFKEAFLCLCQRPLHLLLQRSKALEEPYAAFRELRLSSTIAFSVPLIIFQAFE